MNAGPFAEQQQIFDGSMEAAELAAVDALVAKHQSNAALTQQLALDASKLVSTSQQRLAQQAGAGFFKRFASAVSGKTSENQLLNQIDMLQIQKFAWHYLQQLQQQNLINAQAISVIRNNLGTMNAVIIETRDFLEQAVDKIDQRLRHVENNTSFSRWALNIEANKRRFKSTPSTLLILRLTFDFMRSHPGVGLSEHDVSNYLLNTLEKLDINCDEQVELLDFIGELIDQIDVAGIEQYRKMIALSFDEHVIDSGFIQKNISGIGFNALYFLSDQYERIIDLTGDAELCNSDEARTKIISKFFGSEFSALATSYSIRHLICEIIGGSQVAIDVYKEEHGLNPLVANGTEALPSEDVVALVSSLPDIRTHTFFDGKHSKETKRAYLLLFALCVDNSAALNASAREFIALLGARAGCADIDEEVRMLADHPRKLIDYQPIMQSLLNDTDKQYTWLFDALFLVTLAGKPIDNPYIKTILGVLKPDRLKECLPDLRTVLEESDPSKVLQSSLRLAPSTQGWKNMVRYRALRFEPYFAETVNGLYAANWASTRLLLGMSEIYSKGMEHAYYISYSDGSFLDNMTEKASAALCNQGRKSAMSGLNEFRKKALAFLSEHRSALNGANWMVSKWNVPSFDFKDEIGYGDIDLDNSAGNEDWGDQFQHCYNQVENTLNAFDNACTDVGKQIALFIAGDFDQSVLAIKEQKRAEYLSKQQQEKLEKQSVTLIEDGVEYLFGIDWQRVEHPPCDPSKIDHIKTDGKIWLVVATIGPDEIVYRSENGTDWQQIQIDAQMKVWLDGVSVVNGVWIIKNRALRNGTREQGYYYSSNGLEWQHVEIPGGAQNSQLSMRDGSLSFKNIIFFNGMWLWAATKYKEYSYVETGLFRDATKTGWYDELVLFMAPTLQGPWQLWEYSPQFALGVKVDSVCSLPGGDALLAFCDYDSSYIRDRKLPDKATFMQYFGAAKTWQRCDWESTGGFHRAWNEPLIHRMGNQLLCFGSRELLVSSKGYDWRQQESDLNVEKCCSLGDFSLFIGRSSEIHVSQDGKLFEEMLLEDGVWRHLGANEAGLLGVYYANRHEETVLRFGRYISQAKPGNNIVGERSHGLFL